MNERQFERRKSNSVYWYNKAVDLRGSAAALWATMQDEEASQVAERLGLGRDFTFRIACWPVYRMLCGLSLELMFKAIIVARGASPPATHDLVRLSEQAGVATDAHDSGLLSILSEAILWDGKYPVPKQEVRLEALDCLASTYLADKVPIGTLHVLRPNGALDWESFGRLWTLVAAHYRQ